MDPNSKFYIMCSKVTGMFFFFLFVIFIQCDYCVFMILVARLSSMSLYISILPLFSSDKQGWVQWGIFQQKSPEFRVWSPGRGLEEKQIQILFGGVDTLDINILGTVNVQNNINAWTTQIVNVVTCGCLVSERKLLLCRGLKGVY